jgi:hypothetical protein
MERTIFKYQLDLGPNDVQMPEGAEVLDVQMQRGEICLWALVSPSAPEVDRIFTIFGTGHPVPADGLKFIATIQASNGALVRHVFEVTD